jgi:DNA-binding protein HU-beta
MRPGATGDMQKVISKSELNHRIAERSSGGLKRDDVKQVLDALVDIGHAELKDSGTFVLPGFAKFSTMEKPATEAHQGVNPFGAISQNASAVTPSGFGISPAWRSMPMVNHKTFPSFEA